MPRLPRLPSLLAEVSRLGLQLLPALLAGALTQHLFPRTILEVPPDLVEMIDKLLSAHRPHGTVPCR